MSTVPSRFGDRLYHKSINRIDGKTLPIAPEEWDFRTIREEELDYAIFYEYARSCEWLVKIFQDWHQQELRFPKNAGEAYYWNGITVKKASQKREKVDVPWEVNEFISQGTPEDLGLGQPVDTLCSLDPLFPVPFLKSEWIPSIIKSLAETMPLRPKALAFRSPQGRREFLKHWPGSYTLR